MLSRAAERSEGPGPDCDQEDIRGQSLRETEPETVCDSKTEARRQVPREEGRKEGGKERRKRIRIKERGKKDRKEGRQDEKRGKSRERKACRESRRKGGDRQAGRGRARAGWPSSHGIVQPAGWPGLCRGTGSGRGSHFCPDTKEEEASSPAPPGRPAEVGTPGL